MTDGVHQTPNGDVMYHVSYPKTATHLLVFLHGYGGDMNAWKYVIEHLDRKKFACVAIDLIGHGRSYRPKTEDADLRTDIIRSVLRIIERENSHHLPITLVGHCYGGLMSIMVVGKYPRLAANLVLINSGYSVPSFLQPFSGDMFNTFVKRVFQLLPENHIPKDRNYDRFIGTGDFNVWRLFDDIRHVGYRHYMVSGSFISNTDLRPVIKTIQIETLVIGGQNDHLYPPLYTRDFASHFPRHKLIILPNTNHIGIINNPAEIARHIASFSR